MCVCTCSLVYKGLTSPSASPILNCCCCCCCCAFLPPSFLLSPPPPHTLTDLECCLRVSQHSKGDVTLLHHLCRCAGGNSTLSHQWVALQQQQQEQDHRCVEWNQTGSVWCAQSPCSTTVEKDPYNNIALPPYLALCAVPDHHLGKFARLDQVLCHGSAHDTKAQEAYRWSILCHNHFVGMIKGRLSTAEIDRNCRIGAASPPISL